MAFPGAYGDKMHIEVLEISSLLIKANPRQMHPHRTEVMKFGWGRIKREETKPYAFHNVACFLENFEAPQRIGMQARTASHAELNCVELSSSCCSRRRLYKHSANADQPALTLRGVLFWWIAQTHLKALQRHQNTALQHWDGRLDSQLLPVCMEQPTSHVQPFPSFTDSSFHSPQRL